jgi:hypothetical protein
MTRSSVRKAHPLPEPPGLEMSPVVRATKVIPVMPGQPCGPEPSVSPQVSRCTGRCGHCDIHPCQLHPSV